MSTPRRSRYCGFWRSRMPAIVRYAAKPTRANHHQPDAGHDGRIALCAQRQVAAGAVAGDTRLGARDGSQTAAKPPLHLVQRGIHVAAQVVYLTMRVR